MNARKFLDIDAQLCRELDDIRFALPVALVYNPLTYASIARRAYFERFIDAGGSGQVIFLGMNPGPWGMAQTGVPFGEVTMVRDWLGIHGPVDRPKKEHPRRPVLGFDCHRSEVSGKRFWGWAKDQFETPARFFQTFFVANYCPLMFLDQGGANITPDKLKADERSVVENVCDEALCRLVKLLKTKSVIGIGKYAEKRAIAALADIDVAISSIPHPSPANPAANRGWAKQVNALLEPFLPTKAEARVT